MIRIINVYFSGQMYEVIVNLINNLPVNLKYPELEKTK